MTRPMVTVDADKTEPSPAGQSHTARQVRDLLGVSLAGLALDGHAAVLPALFGG